MLWHRQLFANEQSRVPSKVQLISVLQRRDVSTACTPPGLISVGTRPLVLKILKLGVSTWTCVALTRRASWETWAPLQTDLGASPHVYQTRFKNYRITLSPSTI